MRYRVLVHRLPRILGDVIQEIAREEPDIDAVHVEDEYDLDAVVNECAVDVIVTALQDERLPLDCRQLLDRRRHLRVVAFADGGHSGIVYELHPRMDVLEQISQDAFLAAIRARVPIASYERSGC